MDSFYSTRPPFLEGNSPASRSLTFLGITLLSLSFFSRVSVVLLKPLFGINPLAAGGMIEDFSSPGTRSVLEFLQIVQAIGLFIAPVLFFSWLHDRNVFSFPMLNKKVHLISIGMVIVLMIAAQPLINYLGELNSRLVLPESLKSLEDWMKSSEDQAAKLTELFLNVESLQEFSIVFMMVAILPAIGEEMLFRGSVQRLLGEWTKNSHIAILISALLFSALHMQFYGFVPRMLLGVLLGYLFLWSGSLWLPITAHFVNNGLAVVLIFLNKKGMISFDPDKIGTGENQLVSVMASALFVVLIIWQLQKREAGLKNFE